MEKNILFEIVKLRKLFYGWKWLRQKTFDYSFYELDRYVQMSEKNPKPLHFLVFPIIDKMCVDVEYRLFSIQKEDRTLFINSILYHLFVDKFYFFRINSALTQDFVDAYIDEIEDEHGDALEEMCGCPVRKKCECGIGEEDNYSVREELYSTGEIDSEYLIAVKDVLRTIHRISEDFDLKYNTEKYPIQRLIDIEVPTDRPNCNKLQLPKNLLERLQEDGFIENTTANLLKWLKDLQDLKMFVDTFFLNEKSKWKKTVATFIDNEGKAINYNSIRNLNPAYKEDPPSKAYFEKLKKDLER